MVKERLNKNFLEEFREFDFSIIKETLIYLIGSAKFKDYFIKIESILQIIHKKLVSICSIDGILNKHQFSYEEWEKLQETALRKLHYQEAVLVLDINNYIGDHSKEEIDYFKNNVKKPIYYFSSLRRSEKN